MTTRKDEIDEICIVLEQAKKIAHRYRVLTGKPLGITGEIAEFECARLLGLELADARQAGYDAIRIRNGKRQRLQIKGRCVPPGSRSSQRLGKIDIGKPFDGVLLVLMDEHFNATAIYEAGRQNVTDAIRKPGSKARNERGQLSVSQFKRVATLVWSDKSIEASAQK